MKKILLFIICLIIFNSCENSGGLVFDVDSGQSIVTFSTSSITFPVSDAGESAINVIVESTTRSSSDRTIVVNADASSTATSTMYTIENAVIKANEFTGAVKIIGNFNNLPATGEVKLVLNLTSVENATKATYRQQVTITMFRFCPFASGVTFTGTYKLETVSNGIFGTPTFTAGNVTVSQGANVAERKFNVRPYPAFGVFNPIEFKFNLICGKVVVADGQLTGVGCGGSTSIGGPTVQATYNPASDAEIIINITDDKLSNCVTPVQATFKLVKQ